MIELTILMYAHNLLLDYKVAPANARNGLDRLEELACLNEGPEWFKGVTFSQTQETAGTFAAHT